jgi:hypothetical protein
MYKYKFGDRVINTASTTHIPDGAHGTVQEESDTPWVKWDNGILCCRSEDYLALEDGRPSLETYSDKELIAELFRRHGDVK